jgi:hypothetical protein
MRSDLLSVTADFSAYRVSMPECSGYRLRRALTEPQTAHDLCSRLYANGFRYGDSGWTLLRNLILTLMAIYLPLIVDNVRLP